MLLTPDPTFYPSPRLAMQAPAERLAYVALLNPAHDGRPDGMAVVDVDPASSSYGRVVGRIDMPHAPHPHIERRYLITPGLRSSRIYVIDTKPDPRKPKIVKTIEPEEVAMRT